MRAFPPDDPNALAVAAARSGLQRFWIFAAVAMIEVAFAASVFRFAARPLDLPYWRDPIFLANALAKLALVAFALFLVALWPRRHEILYAYRRSTAHAPYARYIILNGALFATLIAARYALTQAAEQPLPVLAAYAVLPLLTGASLALIAAPVSFWRRLLTLAPAELAVAVTVTGAAAWLGAVAKSSWYSLSDATLAVSSWMLHLYEPGAFVDFDKRILAVGDFSVEVWGPCSGYEGIVLILTLLPLYLWTFRRDLRFPNALLLLPLGIAAVWTLNAVRIALLVSIGAHVSPEIALQGFHSQAGWVGFLVVTLGVIAVSRQVPFFAATPESRRAAAAVPAAPADATLAYLAPFMAMLAANILASAFAPHDQWLYPIKVLGIGCALWWFRGVYLPLLVGVSWTSLAIGLAVGALWIVTDPGRGAPTELGLWLSGLPLWTASIWLLLRGIGTIALVPVAEELAFRGFLARALVSMRFESVGFGDFRPAAFVLSSLAFGLMHERWLAGLLAGAVYALLMYRSKRLSDPIAAHAASNAVIFAWAVAAQQWSLL